ncbi:hypothetical protein QYH69_20235 [Paraburkholderia sp. SARCC-3016]|uniref:hypothetical protein n=1 Tax=Paraburkholderia sp. SARCC-3016 TaxID=3058611 RepID=UPI002809D1B3|nr:hypothetical protein [Paraburkholderia sp. SARCC-3016]MDQ7979577.1 hypothetical protein [Paraburkholderia sp. SARCC-3016]
MAGAAGAAVGAALGGSAGALSGANGATSADLYNRQLHPQERQLIKDKANELAAQQAQNPADQQKLADYWTNMLTIVADADVDSQARTQLEQYVGQLMQAAQAAQASGNNQDLQYFLGQLSVAQGYIQQTAAQPITDGNDPIVADDGVLKTFQPTGSQFTDSSLFGTPGGTSTGLAIGETPSSAGIGNPFYTDPNGPTNQQLAGFESDLLESMGIPNGAITPAYPIENIVLQGVAGKAASAVLDYVLGIGEVTLASGASKLASSRASDAATRQSKACMERHSTGRQFRISQPIATMENWLRQSGEKRSIPKLD